MPIKSQEPNAIHVTCGPSFYNTNINREPEPQSRQHSTTKPSALIIPQAMADNLIFPIGFDLHAAINPTGTEWYQKYAHHLSSIACCAGYQFIFEDNVWPMGILLIKFAGMVFNIANQKAVTTKP